MGDAPLVYTHAIKTEDVEAYCKVCGLTVKHIKPEPKVENIKPPEWGTEWPDGEVRWFRTREQRDKYISDSGVVKPVRIDWGAK